MEVVFTPYRITQLKAETPEEEYRRKYPNWTEQERNFQQEIDLRNYRGALAQEYIAYRQYGGPKPSEQKKDFSVHNHFIQFFSVLSPPYHTLKLNDYFYIKYERDYILQGSLIALSIVLTIELTFLFRNSVRKNA